ncbi:MAG: DUF1840 domain-containing protein [Granulosicoccus sp.]
MLVTFKTNAYSDITMFGTAAVALLKIMGQSGNVPGAIMADEVPEALRQLNEGLAALGANSGDSAEQALPESTSSMSNAFDDEEQQATIGLDKRAGPLISLLEAAIAANENVLWGS